MENKSNVFGAVNWEIDTSNGFKPRENNKDLYLRLEAGSNVVRVLTKPHEYLVHQWKVNEKDPGFGTRILSSKFHGSDILEEKYGSKAKRRWLLYVIDRKTNSVKLLDISKSVFDGIRELVRDSEDWGDPGQYDIDIKVDKQGGASGYYKIVPKSKKPLSPADLELKQSLDLDLLKLKCTPPTVEAMNARVEATIAKSPNGLKSAEPKNDVAVAAHSNVEVQDDFDFPEA